MAMTAFSHLLLLRVVDGGVDIMVQSLTLPMLEGLVVVPVLLLRVVLVIHQAQAHLKEIMAGCGMAPEMFLEGEVEVLVR